MITIKEALTKKEMKEFVMFSFELYKDNPNWIPPLIADELETFDKTKNPALQTALIHPFREFFRRFITFRITVGQISTLPTG